MFGALESDRGTPREPHTLAGARWKRESARGVDARIRRIEDAWAMHATGATGFGAGETAFVEVEG